MSDTFSPSAFEMQFLLWSLRHRIKNEASEGPLALELAATFSRSGAALAAENINRLAGVLARHGRDFSSAGSARPTHLEDILLGAYASRRRGDVASATRLTAGLAGRDAQRRHQLSVGLQGIADLFSRQPPSEHFRRLSAFRTQVFRDTTPVWLSPGLDMMIIFAMRVWVAAHKSGLAALRTIQASLAEGPADIDWRALDAVLHNASTGARRPIEINCLCFQEISADERMFLSALGAMQRGEVGTAVDLLWQWQQPAAARLSISALEIFAGSMRFGDGRAESPASESADPPRPFHDPSSGGRLLH